MMIMPLDDLARSAVVAHTITIVITATRTTHGKILVMKGENGTYISVYVMSQ